MSSPVTILLICVLMTANIENGNCLKSPLSSSSISKLHHQYQHHSLKSSAHNSLLPTFPLQLLDQFQDNPSQIIQNNYRRVGPDDDEIHDEEILKAVQSSLYQFYFRKMLMNNGSANHPHANNTSPKHHVRNRRGIKMVCYGVLGCFRDEGVFDYLDMVPAPPEEINTKFFLFTRKSKEPEIYTWDNYTSAGARGFNSSNPTKIIVHGFGSTCLRMWASEMRQALLAVLDCNVICVDWENGAALPNYVRAAVNTRLVGKQLSLFISSLNNNYGARHEDVHLVGFSLGAHVAGFAGSEIKNLSRITGLDPAGPLFESYDPKVRLDASDAMFVDVIHSNGNSLLMGGLGSFETLGHLDFYPNGGRAQKGCSHMFLGAFRDLIWSPSGSSSSTQPPQTTTSQPQKSILQPPPPPPHMHSKIRMRMLPIGTDPLHPPMPPPTTTPPPPPPPQETDGRSLCNHRRAYKFFTESVSPRCQFPAFFCESFDKYLTGACFHGIGGNVPFYNMGYYADVGWKHGSPRVVEKNRLLYLATRDEEPFCANQYRIRVESSPSPAPISTYGGLEAIVIGSNGLEHGENGVEFVNNTFLVTQTPKDSMVAGSILQRLVVAHPTLTSPVKVILKYTAYQGWLYSGISRWSMDRIVITDARGGSSSFCTRGLLLPSGISVTITLTPGICTNHPNPPLQPPPPNYPNYPYETYRHPNKHIPEESLTSLSRIVSNETSMDYSDWQPITNNVTSLEQLEFNITTEAPAPPPPLPPNLGYMSKHILPHDIDNILHDQESSSPNEMSNIPTRLLLGTTRSLKSRPIVLRNRVHREGRAMGLPDIIYYIPVRKKHSNENTMRQVGIKMIQDQVKNMRFEELGDVVSLPPPQPILHHPKRSKSYHHHHHRGLVALRRRKKSRKD